MSQHAYLQRILPRLEEPRLTPLQWLLEHTPLGETGFGRTRSGHLRRSTFQAYSRVARKSERRLLERLNV
jgi:hypothetical protein